jgi:hypothetical protein
MAFYQLESFSFTPSDSFKHSKKIVNVIPGDFTHSGKLDLLIMSPSQVDENLDLSVYFSRVDGFGKSNVSMNPYFVYLLDVNQMLTVLLLLLLRVFHNQFLSTLTETWKLISWVWRLRRVATRIHHYKSGGIFGIPHPAHHPSSRCKQNR